jgi:hypothetical protein
MGRSRAEFYGVAGHGDNLDFDKHIANGSLRLAVPPKGQAYIEHNGDRIPVLPHPDLFSYVSRENDSDPEPKNNTKHWEDGDWRHYEIAKSSFSRTQKRKDFQDKLGQIKRSCPVCSSIMNDQNNS